jgi:hypothetical protein
VMQAASTSRALSASRVEDDDEQGISRIRDNTRKNSRLRDSLDYQPNTSYPVM